MSRSFARRSTPRASVSIDTFSEEGAGHMSHRFDRSQKDPYHESARQVERNIFSARDEFARGAEDQIYETLSNAIVTALGDIAATAYRHGVNRPNQMKDLAKAVAGASETVFTCYRGDIDPEMALQALENDSRRGSLPSVANDRLTAEIEQTRQLEHLILSARRLPDLIDYAGSLGMHVPDDVLEVGTLLIGDHPTPHPDQE